MDTEEICKEDKITIKDSINDKLLESGVNIDIVKYFFNDGVDVFNISSPFYNDICYHYNFTKDVAIKDRVLEFFPNITLCEEGCDLIGINMTSITSICQCFFSDSKKEENLKDKILEQTQLSFVEDIITSSNIYVIKCFKSVFDRKSINKCYGGFFILLLFIAKIILTLIYYKRNIYSINKYIFLITNKYIDYLSQNKTNQKDNDISNKDIKENISIKSINENNAPPKHNKIDSNSNLKKDEQHFVRKTKFGSKTMVNKNNNLIIGKRKI